MDYVVYLIKYLGDKLPPYYIGSSTETKLKNGYRGSISSKKYKIIFKDELKAHPELFDYEILVRCESRQEAIKREREIQLEYDVVKSDQYFNMSIAAPDGFFGMDVSGENNPRYGKPKSKDEILQISNTLKGHKRSQTSIEKQIQSMSGENHWNYGKQHSDETKNKIGSKSKGRKSPKKGKSNEDFYGSDRAREIGLKISSSDWHRKSYSEKYDEEKLNEIRMRTSKQFSGMNNPKAKKWKIISPDNIIYFAEGNLQTVLDELDLPMSAMKDSFRKNSIVSRGKAKGWKLEEVLLP